MKKGKNPAPTPDVRKSTMGMALSFGYGAEYKVQRVRYRKKDRYRERLVMESKAKHETISKREKMRTSRGDSSPEARGRSDLKAFFLSS